VVICVSVGRRAAVARGIPIAHELLLYALHGMLHLCGFDDRTGRAFRAMHAKEDEILTRLGVGPVFRPTPPINRRRLSPPLPVLRERDRVRIFRRISKNPHPNPLPAYRERGK
jgi:hypothetical protein